MKKLFPRLISLALLAALLLAAGAAAADLDWQRPYNKDSGYTYVTFGNYPYEADGAERPILWRFLESREGHSYLMSEYILHVSRLHSIAHGYPGWDQADLNAFLQTDFVKAAFTEEEAAALLEMEGLGRVSLPSADDVRNKDFGFDSDKSRRTIGSPYADAKGLYFYRNMGHSPYWLRTPSERKHAHRSIKLEGNLGYLGVTNSDMGSRPVIWLATDQVEAVSGSGSLEDPFVLKVKAQQ